jgi:hypothetical protein
MIADFAFASVLDPVLTFAASPETSTLVTPALSEREQAGAGQRSAGRSLDSPSPSAERPSVPISDRRDAPCKTGMRSVHDEAVHLAKLGLRIVPVKPGSKVPDLARWQVKATRRPQTIDKWFPKGTNRNIGVRTGKGLVVMDIDPGRGGEDSFAKLTERHGHPPKTAMSHTGSGGWHLLFRTRRKIGNRVDVLPGIDVRGDGGLVVVPPSVHPVTEKRYAWVHHPSEGIADLPDWLGKIIRGGDDTRREQKPTRILNRRPEPTRKGDGDALLREIIDDFPVRHEGTRNVQMARAIGNLVGREYEANLIRCVMRRWHQHFFASGKARTSVEQGIREIERCLHGTLQNRKFTKAAGVDHRETVRQIELGDETRTLIRTGRVITDGDGHQTLAPSPPYIPHGTGVTHFGQTYKRLCESRDEEAFVEVVLAHALHELERPQNGLVLMTRTQINTAAADRFDGLRWHPQQFERLKAKYITREADGKPATRFELMREIVKGSRRPGQSVGEPSKYELTGILCLLPEDVRQILVPSTAKPEGVSTYARAM